MKGTEGESEAATNAVGSHDGHEDGEESSQ